MSSTGIEIPGLETFVDERWITDVLYELKSGKEATAFCCAGGPTSRVEFVAAKCYRAVERRGFRNDAVYQAGRFDAAKRRERLAFEKKSRIGRDIQFTSWVAEEFRTLQVLHAAGADVPRPITKSSDVILMEFIGDGEGAAPPLHAVRLSHDEARTVFRRLLWNVELFLAQGRIHGDLSAYNILWWEGRAIVIDFPQAVDPHVNPHAAGLLERDITNLCRHFVRQGVQADPARIAGDMWMRWRFGGLAAST